MEINLDRKAQAVLELIAAALGMTAAELAERMLRSALAPIAAAGSSSQAMTLLGRSSDVAGHRVW